MENGKWKVKVKIGMESRPSVLRDKSYAFALRIVNLCQELSEEKREFVLSKQVRRSGTSIGANIAEATQAQSTADFVHKLSIAHKESFETEFWLCLLRDSEYIAGSQANSLISECCEIQKMLTASIKTAKGR